MMCPRFNLCGFGWWLLVAMSAGCLSTPTPYGQPMGQPMPGQQGFVDPGQPQAGGQWTDEFGNPIALQNNPVFVPVQDPNLLWDQLVDVVDDYFQIEREDRVRLVGDVLTEGRMTTFPRGASTIFEPWNRDSVTSFDRWQATLQSYRRHAQLRVIPVEGGYLVEVVVNKELEDVAKPDATFIGDESLRNDSSYKRFSDNITGSGASLGWIPKGRDLPLEQEIILQLQARFGQFGGPAVPVFTSENPPPTRIQSGMATLPVEPAR
jgi:hypothetical protein